SLLRLRKGDWRMPQVKTKKRSTCPPRWDECRKHLKSHDLNSQAIGVSLQTPCWFIGAQLMEKPWSPVGAKNRHSMLRGIARIVPLFKGTGTGERVDPGMPDCHSVADLPPWSLASAWHLGIKDS